MQTAYSNTMPVGYAGMLYDSSFMTKDSYANAQGAAIPFGVVVAKGTGDQDATLPDNSADIMLGIVVHTHAYDQSSLTGTDGVPANRMLNAVKRGRIWVLVEEAVTKGDPVYVRIANGVADVTKTQKGALRKSADTATAVLLAGAHFYTSAAAGALSAWRLEAASPPAKEPEMGRFQNLDAAENAFFGRELEHVKAGLYDVQYPELRARRFIPVSNEASPGAETIAYYSYDSVGMAKLIKAYADDLPRADVKGTRYTSPVESIGNSYGYNIQEVRAAALAGRPLPAMKARAARRAHEEKVDEIAAVGDTSTGLKGFLNHANVSAASVANPGSGTTWAVKKANPQHILDDIQEAVSSIFTTTKSTETPDTVILPPSQFGLLSQLRMTEMGSTLMAFFLQSNPWIRNIDYWHRLTGAGAGATDRMVIYRRDPEVLQLEIPQEFEQFPVQERNLEFVVPCHSRIGGVSIYRPLAIVYRDGI
jgi:hypothetical protein